MPRHSDPTKIPVQLNIQIPWDFREFLYDEAERQSKPFAEVVREAILDKYREAFKRSKAQR